MLPILVLFVLFARGLEAAAEPADVIVVNATIYTVNPKQPTAREMAVRGGRIVAVGETAAEFRGPHTQVLDLAGATVVPGLIDSHVHMAGLGSLLEMLDLRGVATISEVAARVRRKAAALPKGSWILGRNWDQTNWGGEFPVAADLAEAAPEHPVFLSRVDGHAAWVNARALKMAGVDRQTPDPIGGRIVRDGAGMPAGVLIDRAQELVGDHIPKPGAAEIRKQLQAAAAACVRLGLTSVHDAGVSAEVLQAYRELGAEKKLPVRVYAMIGGEGALWREYLRRGPEIGDFLTVRSIKLMADGAMGSRGAAFWQPYADDPGNTGLLILRRDTIEKVAREAAAKGFQVNTHAIGDRANRTVLDAYAAVLGPDTGRRFRMEHAQVVSLPDFVKFRELGVIASMQPTHATSDMRWAAARLGPDRLAGAYAWRRMLDNGIRIAGGSDFPVEDANPLLGFYAAVTRQDLQGRPDAGWVPEQRLTRADALHAFTLAGAYAAFEETQKGSLEVGKRADFVVLDTDIMKAPAAALPHTKVRMTFVGGERVYGQP